MLKWKIAALLAVVFGAVGLGWGYAQQRNAIGFYELRIYTAQPGKRDALAKRFADRTAAIYARHGVTNVGYWIPQQSDAELGITAENTFIYIRGYPDEGRARQAADGGARRPRVRRSRDEAGTQS